MPAPRALVVSLHDVSPRTRGRCAEMLAELTALGVPKCALLVIPDHHQHGHFLADAAFCRWLEESARAGHEIVLHGYTHRRARRPGESAAAKITTRFYTADEGEFYDLDRATARALVARGQAELRRAGLDPRGFIAPAWLLGREAAIALRELGVEYTTTLGAVVDLQNERTWKSQSLVWSVRSGWRRAVSRAWNAALFRRLRSHSLLRLSIHPVDRDHPAVWSQIRALLARALRDREPMTYHAWIAGQRAASSPSSFSSSSSFSIPSDHGGTGDETEMEMEMKKKKKIL